MRVPILIWCGGLVALTSYELLAQSVNHYGDLCDEDIQCADHRLSCKPNSTEDSEKICLCISFFTWNENLQECVPAMNMSAILKSLLEQRDIHKLNSMTEHDTFMKLGIVGLISVFTLIIFILCCIAYGCCACTRVKDKGNIACPDSCPSQKAPLLKGVDDKWRDLPSTLPVRFDAVDI